MALLFLRTCIQRLLFILTGELALIATDSGEPFVFEDLGPDLTQDGTAVFDIPTSALKPAPEVCFGEMGFGPSRGCIALNRMR